MAMRRGIRSADSTGLLRRRKAGSARPMPRQIGGVARAPAAGDDGLSRDLLEWAHTPARIPWLEGADYQYRLGSHRLVLATCGVAELLRSGRRPGRGRVRARRRRAAARLRLSVRRHPALVLGRPVQLAFRAPGRTGRAGGGPADAGDLRPALGDALDHPRGYRHGAGPHRPGRGPAAGVHARPARRAPRAGHAAVPGRGRRPGIGRAPIRGRPLGAAGPCEDQVCRRIGSRGPMGFDPDGARRRSTGHLDEETP